MATAHDVAAYILDKLGEMSAMKLQKLLYYSQAWQLVWEDRPLFPQRIQAWANGPVVQEVYACHRGQFSVGPTWPRGDASRLGNDERETIDAVINAYGHLSGQQLSHLTHSEDPWCDARGDLSPTVRSTNEITPAAMAEFYAALDAAEEAQPIDQIEWIRNAV